jgi:hypothetical protein
MRVVAVIALLLAMAPAVLAASPGFSRQIRVGYTAGDQWEPSVAADGFGHVYVLYPQYGRVPSCAGCPLPTMVLVMSFDNGASWQPPRQILTSSYGQFDPQIVVDPADRRTVFASWLQNNKRDAVVARSSDFGQTWSVAVAYRAVTDVDKPVLAVRGGDVYLGINHDEEVFVAASHDGGATFTSRPVDSNPAMRWSLLGGGTVDPDGNVYFAWAGYLRGRKGEARLLVSKSEDGGQSWTTKELDSSAAPSECTAAKCGWAYLGAQITIASDSAGTLYALWNSGATNKGPERMYFSTSTTGGDLWSPRSDVSRAPDGVTHAFPAVAAGGSGDVRITWMDARNHSRWNAWYRSSTNGGATWSEELRMSGYVPGYRYISQDGFAFPFGDYFGLAIDSLGQAKAVFGEGQNYLTPGSIWYTSTR